MVDYSALLLSSFWSQSARVNPQFVEQASIAKYVGVPRESRGPGRYIYMNFYNTYVEGLPDS